MCTHRRICNIAREAGEAAARNGLDMGAIYHAMVLAAEKAGENFAHGELDIFQTEAERIAQQYRTNAA